jgi:hypothetical protein
MHQMRAYGNPVTFVTFVTFVTPVTFVTLFTHSVQKKACRVSDRLL